MSTSEESSVPMLNVQIDGKWMKFPKGTRVLEACQQASKEVPHYCYHPKLSSPGNCRMCLIEMGMPPRVPPGTEPPKDEHGMPVIQWIPRPQISCAQTIAEGMGVRTDSPMVKECREGVMEFLLINHPLDCPICDQAGECKLQEYSVEHGCSTSRFLDEKVKKPKHVNLGPRIVLDDERCILCTRCIRFSKEIVGDDSLGITERGSHNTIGCHPDFPFENDYTLNTVDICPVGALTSKDFRFQMRVWFLKETKSFCTSCATGCNTVISSRENRVYRQTPRENDAVNECWMCDHGRLNFHYLEDPQRLLTPTRKANGQSNGQREATTWPDAISAAAAALKAHSGERTAIIASGKMTNEELFLVKKLADLLKIEQMDIVTHTGEGDELLISADKNPNGNGAVLLQVCPEKPGEKLRSIADGINSGTIKTLLLLSEDAGLLPEELEKLDCLIALDILPNPANARASILLPGAGFAEKRGSMINANGRLQRLNRAVNPPGQARDDWEILRDLIAQLGGDRVETIEELFQHMAATVQTFEGLSLSKIGDLGLQLLDLPGEQKKIGKKPNS